MKKIICFILFLCCSCSTLPEYSSGYVITKDNRKFELKEGCTGKWHTDGEFFEDQQIIIIIKPKNIKTINLEYGD